MTNYKVYVSHSVRDKDLARKIADGIMKVGAEPIMVEETIRPGQDWLEEIRRNLRSCDEMVVVLSEDSVHNEWVSIEMGAAFGLHKLTTPITANLDHRKLPTIVRALQAVTSDNIDAYFRELGRRVEKTSGYLPQVQRGDSSYEIRVANELSFRRVAFDRNPQIQGHFIPDFAVPSSRKPKFFVEVKGNLTNQASFARLNHYASSIKSEYPRVKRVILARRLNTGARKRLLKYWNYVFEESQMDDFVELLRSQNKS